MEALFDKESFDTYTDLGFHTTPEMLESYEIEAKKCNGLLDIAGQTFENLKQLGVYQLSPIKGHGFEYESLGEGGVRLLNRDREHVAELCDTPELDIAIVTKTYTAIKLGDEINMRYDYQFSGRKDGAGVNFGLTLAAVDVKYDVSMGKVIEVNPSVRMNRGNISEYAQEIVSSNGRLSR